MGEDLGGGHGNTEVHRAGRRNGGASKVSFFPSQVSSPGQRAALPIVYFNTPLTPS